jgi:hypothetical protein
VLKVALKAENWVALTAAKMAVLKVEKMVALRDVLLMTMKLEAIKLVMINII